MDDLHPARAPRDVLPRLRSLLLRSASWTAMIIAGCSFEKEEEPAVEGKWNGVALAAKRTRA